ncbi:YccF domain-containing protein [Streptococcus macacae]|uniref:Inner membrane component domain-containing protein n=1 Tax=Streptococcus macacae NCTC 11558 TaxID=764298 RepID=G5JYN8_9STRE|nr:hypothetical protein STRMA_0300 [Streptococcus macacae NCTC 11558]SUN78151.1 Inner membrane protein yccF [Streptococcus macacae NCTC 11558]
MRLLGNIIWFLCSGIWALISWTAVGFILCLTIIGIPFALQSAKMAGSSLFPFGVVIMEEV